LKGEFFLNALDWELSKLTEKQFMLTIQPQKFWYFRTV
jgi:hypothetical protein